MIRELQERAARARPAEHVSFVDGWWLRLAPGTSSWISSVLPHGDGAPDELAGRVDVAERFYDDHGLPTRFQITPGACSPELDGLLAERGYRLESPVLVSAASARAVRSEAPVGLRVAVDAEPSEDWLDVWHAINGGDPAAERRLLARVQPPSGYARVWSADGVVAVGRAVADHGWAGVFGMATRPEARGLGAGRLVLAGLAEWAGAHRTDWMYLQVVRENGAAVRLYERSGFAEVGQYHYRVRAPGAPVRAPGAPAVRPG